MRNVFQSPEHADAALVRDVLVKHGFAAKLIEGRAASAQDVHSEVWIPADADADEARRIVQSVFEREG